MNPVLLTCAACLLACAGLTVGGVYVLAGLGWSLLAGAACALGFAEILRRGMISGG